eukprot:149953-Chlamydomonas_euryale.AAC.1
MHVGEACGRARRAALVRPVDKHVFGGWGTRNEAGAWAPTVLKVLKTQKFFGTKPPYSSVSCPTASNIHAHAALINACQIANVPAGALPMYQQEHCQCASRSIANVP